MKREDDWSIDTWRANHQWSRQWGNVVYLKCKVPFHINHCHINTPKTQNASQRSNTIKYRKMSRGLILRKFNQPTYGACPKMRSKTLSLGRAADGNGVLGFRCRFRCSWCRTRTRIALRQFPPPTLACTYTLHATSTFTADAELRIKVVCSCDIGDIGNNFSSSTPGCKSVEVFWFGWADRFADQDLTCRTWVARADTTSRDKGGAARAGSNASLRVGSKARGLRNHGFSCSIGSRGSVWEDDKLFRAACNSILARISLQWRPGTDNSELK